MAGDGSIALYFIYSDSTSQIMSFLSIVDYARYFPLICSQDIA
jgi:hypothetical protein